MKCPKDPEHELVERGVIQECLPCDQHFRECESGKDACKGFDALKQAARDAKKEVPTVPLMLYARPGGKDRAAYLYDEKTPIFRISGRLARCSSCRNAANKEKKRAASASPTREVEAEGETDFRGGGEPCLGHIAKSTPCTEMAGIDGLCGECAKEFKKERDAGVGYLRNALIVVAIASSSREFRAIDMDKATKLTWLDNYRRPCAGIDVDRDPVGELERQECFQKEETVLAIFGVGEHIEGAARMAAVKERFLAIQALFDDERVRNPRFVSSKLQQWMEGAPGDKPKKVVLMPAYWWGLHKTNFAPQLRPSNIGTTGMDLTTLLKRENDYLWHDTDQHPIQHLLRDGSMVPDKVPDGENHKKYDKKRCSASGKIYLQPMSKYIAAFDSHPRTYENMLEDMRGVFSDTSRFVFQDQCVPVFNVPVERFFDTRNGHLKYEIGLYNMVTGQEIDVWKRIDTPEERRKKLGYYWHDGVRPVQERKKGKLMLLPGKPAPPPGHYL